LAADGFRPAAETRGKIKIIRNANKNSTRYIGLL